VKVNYNIGSKSYLKNFYKLKIFDLKGDSTSENNENIEVEKKNESLFTRMKNWLKRFFDFSRYDKLTKTFMIFFIIIVVLMAAIYLYQFLIDDTFLPRIVFEYVIIPLRDIGIWGALLFFGLMVLQSIIAPIPSEMVLFASGLVWGLAGGSVVGYIGSMISAIIGYYIAYRGGRPLAINSLGEKNVDSLEYFMSKYGTILVLGMRAVPMVPYDLFTLASGFTQMKMKKYLLATGIGTVPRVIFYSWLGIVVSGGASFEELIDTYHNDPVGFLELFENSPYTVNFNFILGIIIGVVIIGFFVFYALVLPYMKRSYERKKGKGEL